MSSSPKFPLPEGVIEIEGDYEINLVHYELLHLKPQGTILFSGEKKERKFQFFVTENKQDGIFARFNEPLSQQSRGLLDYLKKYPRTESFITITLLQFKLLFTAQQIMPVIGAKNHTFHFKFPEKIFKIHRRKFIRIPFNDAFPAELRFQTPEGLKIRKLKDLSREGVRVALEEGDSKYIYPGARIKGASLKVINKEVPLGLQVITVYPNLRAGCKIIAITETDRQWLKDCVRLLIKQILNLPDSAHRIVEEGEDSQ